MLEPIMNVLGSQRVILASSSPRRQEILRNVGLKFEVIPSLYEENLNPDHFKEPDEFVIATALHKVQEVEERLRMKKQDYDIIIGADTMVHMNNKFYGKPKNEQEAFSMLKSFSGKYHTVISGVCVHTKKEHAAFSEKTKVYFGELSDDVVNTYVKTGEPLDKAGGYGIQVKGGTFIEKIDGDYFNVVGLPLYSLCKTLLRLYSDVKK